MFIIFNKLLIQVIISYGSSKTHVILGLNITHGYVMANIITSKSGNIKEDLRHHAEVLEMAMSSKISSPWLEPYKSEKMWVISSEIFRDKILHEVYRWAVYRSKRQCPYISCKLNISYQLGWKDLAHPCRPITEKRFLKWRWSDVGLNKWDSNSVKN